MYIPIMSLFIIFTTCALIDKIFVYWVDVSGILSLQNVRIVPFCYVQPSKYEDFMIKHDSADDIGDYYVCQRM